MRTRIAVPNTADLLHSVEVDVSTLDGVPIVVVMANYRDGTSLTRTLDLGGDSGWLTIKHWARKNRTTKSECKNGLTDSDVLAVGGNPFGTQRSMRAWENADPYLSPPQCRYPMNTPLCLPGVYCREKHAGWSCCSRFQCWTKDE